MSVIRADGDPAQPTPVPGSAAWWRWQRTRTRRTSALTAGRIVEEALRLLDRDGLDALTMRRLAAALGTGAGSLYRHFESREALLVAVHDHAIGELLAVAPSGSTPVERVATFARSLRTLVRRRPYLAELWRTTQQLGPNALRARERGLQAGLACGLAPEAAARAYLTVLHYTIAFSSLEQGLALISEADREGAAELFASLPAEEFPATRSAAHVLTRTTLNEEFEAGLQALLAGIGIGAAHLPESTPPIRRPPV